MFSLFEYNNNYKSEQHLWRRSTRRTLVKNQIIIVAQKMIWRDATAGCGAHHSDAISTLEIRLDRFVVASVTVENNSDED